MLLKIFRKIGSRCGKTFPDFFLPPGNRGKGFKVESSERKFDEGHQLNEVDAPSIQ